MPFDKRPNPSTPGQPPRRPVVHRKPGPPPPIVSYEDVVASCGHPEKFGLFEDRLDRFRKDRRKKVTDRPCKACREKKRLEDEEATKVRRAEKALRAEAQQRAEEAARVTQLQKKKTSHQAGRLPDGAKFEVTYDAAKVKWNGTLTIGDQVFTGSFGALFTLLNRLDQQYRQTLPPPPAAEPEPPAETK